MAMEIVSVSHEKIVMFHSIQRYVNVYQRVDVPIRPGKYPLVRNLVAMEITIFMKATMLLTWR